MNDKINQIIEDVRNNGLSLKTSLALDTNGIRFYRGINSTKESITQCAKHRTSTGPSNIHTILLSKILESWENYPRRDNCVIFSTSKIEAQTYVKQDGSVYCVFSTDNSILGISPTGNIWNAFGIGIKQMNALFTKINERYSGNELTTKKNLIDFFKNIDTRYNNDIQHLEENIRNIIEEDSDMFSEVDKILDFSKEMLESGNCISYLNDYMDPSKNDFLLKKITDDLNFLKGTNYEVWTEYSCLLIRDDLIE
jgi:hypothetical protein